MSVAFSTIAAKDQWGRSYVRLLAEKGGTKSLSEVRYLNEQEVLYGKLSDETIRWAKLWVAAENQKMKGSNLTEPTGRKLDLT